MPFKIGVSGHRKLADPTEIKQEILNFLQKQKRAQSDIIGISALATGADTLFAQAILELGIQLKVVLPFEQALYENDFTPDELKVFHQLLAAASETGVMPGLSGNEPETRNEAYLAAGKAIADESDLMVIIWDGQKAEGKGGTGDIVDYAKETGKEVFKIKAYRTELQKVYLTKDADANVIKYKHYRMWELTICLSFSAAVLFSMVISFSFNNFFKMVLSGAEFIVLLAVLLCIHKLNKTELKKKRIVYRMEAERLRVVETFYNGKIKLLPMPGNEFLSKVVTDLEEKYEKESPGASGFNDGRKKLNELIDEQINYHTIIRTAKNQPYLDALELAQKILVRIFVVLAFLHVVAAWFNYYKDSHCTDYYIPHLLHEWACFISLLIPPAIASIEGYLFFREFKKNLTDSLMMNEFFKVWKNRLDLITQQDELVTLAHEIRLKMDEENRNWAIIMNLTKNPTLS